MSTNDCVHSVTGTHFRSRNEEGSHAIQSAVAENAMLWLRVTWNALVSECFDMLLYGKHGGGFLINLR